MNASRKDLVRNEFYAKAVDQRNLDLVDDLFTADCTFFAAGSTQPVDRAQFKDYLLRFSNALNIQHVVDELIADGNKVVARWTVKGIHQGEFAGANPTNRPIEYRGVSIFTFDGEKITKVWSSFDELGLRRQLGIDHV
jgi:steroid delta-isomerase-like uncharacterized protein